MTIDIVGTFDGEKAAWMPFYIHTVLQAWHVAYCAIEQSEHFPGVKPCKRSNWWDYRLKPKTFAIVWGPGGNKHGLLKGKKS